MRRVVVEYDANSVAWLVDVLLQSRVCLEHGMVLQVEVDARSCWPVPDTGRRSNTHGSDVERAVRCPDRGGRQ
jgi:hypothetical protein